MGHIQDDRGHLEYGPGRFAAFRNLLQFWIPHCIGPNFRTPLRIKFFEEFYLVGICFVHFAFVFCLCFWCFELIGFLRNTSSLMVEPKP